MQLQKGGYKQSYNTHQSHRTYEKSVQKEKVEVEKQQVKKQEIVKTKEQLEREAEANRIWYENYLLEQQKETKRQAAIIKQQEEIRLAEIERVREYEAKEQEFRNLSSSYSTHTGFYTERKLMESYLVEAKKAKLLDGDFPIKLHKLRKRELKGFAKMFSLQKQTKSLLKTLQQTMVLEKYIEYTIIYKIEDDKAWSLYQEDPEEVRSKMINSFTKDYNVKNISFRRGSLEVILVVCAVVSAIAATVQAGIELKNYLNNAGTSQF